jgi:3-hydroxyisobutyrate dehydrogenase
MTAPEGATVRPAGGPADRTRVGVLGLGRMGATIARHLAVDHDVAGWDVRAVDVAGVSSAGDAAALMRDRDVVISCLPSPLETSSVVEDPAFLEAFRSGGAVFVDASTSDPASLRALATRIGDVAVRIVDGPILGRPDRVGAWTIPLGGDAAAAARARPVLECLATRVEHVGPLGSGHAIKLLNNLMFGAINVITAEAIGACSYVGVDPRRFVNLVTGSQAATVSPLFRDLAPRMLGSGDESVFSTALLAKDAALARDMCEAAGVPVRLAPHVASAAAEAVAAGFGGEDSAAVVRLYLADASDDRSSAS